MPSKNVEWQKLVEQALTLTGSLSGIYDRFYDYSFGNQLLLLSQGVREPVATYRKWLELGRQVKKGSKAKLIVQPVTVYKKDDDEDSFVMFKVRPSVFSLSETDGDELPAAESTPSWHATNARVNLGIELADFEESNGNVQGYATDKKIAINPVAKYPLKTLAHEMAHVVLGHTNEHNDSEERKRIKEFQADTVAFIVMNEANAEDGKDWSRTGSAAYIQNWLKDIKPNERDIKPIFSAVDKILKAGKEQPA